MGSVAHESSTGTTTLKTVRHVVQVCPSEENLD